MRFLHSKDPIDVYQWDSVQELVLDERCSDLIKNFKSQINVYQELSERFTIDITTSGLDTLNVVLAAKTERDADALFQFVEQDESRATIYTAADTYEKISVPNEPYCKQVTTMFPDAEYDDIMNLTYGGWSPFKKIETRACTILSFSVYTTITEYPTDIDDLNDDMSSLLEMV
jgi:hypothetical protein